MPDGNGFSVVLIPLFHCSFFDSFSLLLYLHGPTEVSIVRGRAVQHLVVSGMVAVLDDGLYLSHQIVRRAVGAHQQDVLHQSVIPLDLPLCHRMKGCTFRVLLTTYVPIIRSMIGKTAMSNFEFLWEVFDQSWDRFGGMVFNVHPFKQFFPREFARSLTEESAKSNLHQQLAQWAKFAQENVLYEDNRADYAGLEIPEGMTFRVRHKMGPEFTDMWWLIVSAHFNVRCLVYHRMTIEEKIVVACRKFVDLRCTKESRRALYDLLRISKSFLLAEWVHDLIHKAVSNGDQGFFKNLSNALAHELAPSEKSNVAKSWFAVTLLWYLGGRKTRPLSEFMDKLCEIPLSAGHMEEHEFRSMLTKLGLTRQMGAEY